MASRGRFSADSPHIVEGVSDQANTPPATQGQRANVFHRLGRHIGYANVMATVAVFIALGGASYAAIRLPSNSVGARQLKSHAVTPRKVAPATVALFKGQKGEKGVTGPTGAKGDPGAPGSQGAAGAAGLDGASIVDRARSAASVTTSDNGQAIEVPLAENTWTQRANEVDSSSGGRVTFTPPNVPGGCEGDGLGTGYLTVAVYINGNQVASTPDGALMNGVQHTGGLPPFNLFEPGNDLAQTVTVKVSDDCTTAGENFDVTDVKLDIGGTR
jgi:hypothetical protein